MRLHAVFFFTFFLFAALWLNLGWSQAAGIRFQRLEQATPLAMARGGLRVSEPMAELYRHVVGLVQTHSPAGGYIYAAADCPEIYFLADRRNPTRSSFDFFDPDFSTDPVGRRQRILALLEDKQVPVVVLNWRTEFSPKPDPDMVAEIRRRYPQETHFGTFSVHWR